MSLTGTNFTMAELKTSSTANLPENEAVQTKDKPRTRNEARDGKLITSDVGSFFLVVKSSMGSGILAMPYAFHNSGLLLGPICTILVALLCAHCTHILVKSSQELCFLQGKSGMGYIETVENAFKHGSSRRFSKYSTFMKSFASCFLFITYFGTVTIYVIFIASSFKQVIENHLDFTMSIRWYAVVLLLVVLPVGVVRHMKFLIPFSMMANTFLVVGCAVTVYICCVDLPPLSSRPLAVQPAQWPLFFSTALFAMEGIGTILPIENAMRYPAHMLGCPGVLNLSMGIIAAMYLAVGFIGFLKFGDDVQGSITLNLAEDKLSETIKTLVALAILFTYPLQLTATLEVAWGEVQHRFSEKNQDSGYYLVRILLIIGSVLLGALLPNLSPVISLVGALGWSTLGLLIPAVTELATFWDSISKPWGLTMVKTAVLVVLWAFATVTGTVTSVQEILQDYRT